MPDLRDNQPWTRRQAIKNDLLHALARVALRGARALPGPWLARAGHGVGTLAWMAWRGGRRTARTNLSQVFPELDAAAVDLLVRRVFRTMGGYLADAVAQLDDRSLCPGPVLLPDSAAVLARARDEGRGVIFASGHIGPWERVAKALVDAGVPLVTLARRPYDPRFEAIYDGLRARHGTGTIYRGDPGAATRIVRTLRRNGVLGVPMDLRTRAPSVDVPFLGRTAPTVVGPAVLALRTRAPVVVGTAARDGGASVVRITRVPTDDLSNNEGDRWELLRRINEDLGARIREEAHTWPWMHPRWT